MYFKSKRNLEVYTGDGDAAAPFTWLHTYPVFAASGSSGPKLREGDRQVPEGIYRVNFLNEKSRYHLALRLNYPNEFDLKMAGVDERRTLGGDIMIHGFNVSIGCLALGNAAIEELYALASDSNYQRWRVILAPYDPRAGDPPDGFRNLPAPGWYPQVLEQIAAELIVLPTARNGR